MIQRALEAIDAPYTLLNQRHVDRWDLTIGMNGNGVEGYLTNDGRRIPLNGIYGIFARMMDDAELPELRHLDENSPQRQHSRALHGLLVRWLEIANGRVIKRPSAMSSNSSKPYQTQLIQHHGFSIPETLITNDPDLVASFRRRHGRVVYKSISGIRSIVTELEDADLERLDQIRGCPAQFQQCIEGYDVRVHTIGNQVFATRANTTAVDYRYASRQDGDTQLEAIELPDPWSRRCIELAEVLGLAFAGIDLKMTPDGRVFCFEVNPCPVYSYYEENTGQPIVAALARFLSGGQAF
jgi:glutathione synthase/RimK-type ligase-like ATP-grasp enzyme